LSLVIDDDEKKETPSLVILSREKREKSQEDEDEHPSNPLDKNEFNTFINYHYRFQARSNQLT
jgi:hypothetical protein